MGLTRLTEIPEIVSNRFWFLSACIGVHRRLTGFADIRAQGAAAL
jgi:hypothetical protein